MVRAMFAAACSSSVDFPMPGSPPSSTREPGTIPPPSTRSSSPIPVARRAVSEYWTSAYSCAPVEPPGSVYRWLSPPPGAAGDVSGTRSSTSEFHAPHSAQRPIHFGDCPPHSWHTNRTFGSFMCGLAAPRVRVPGSDCLGGIIYALDTGAHAAEHLPRNGPNRGGHLPHVDDLRALTTQEDDLIARRTGHVRNVDGDHVHRDGAHDRRPASAHEHMTAPRQPPIEPVGISCGHHGDLSRRRRRVGCALAHRPAGTQ